MIIKLLEFIKMLRTTCLKFATKKKGVAWIVLYFT